MKRGIWHQFGSQSQTLANDVLEEGVGVGVVVSPRDLKRETAVERAEVFRDLGADVLFDPQFYVPDYTNGPIATYDMDPFRKPIGTLRHLSVSDYADLALRLEESNRLLGASAVMAPAIVYEAGGRDIQRVNRQLFGSAQRAADRLGVPVYSTIVLGHSVLRSDETISETLGAATSHNCDGFFLACEFQEARIPFTQERVERFLNACLTVASTGKPVMHGFAGPMALLSFGAGAQAAAVGHFQNLWQFDRARFGPTQEQGGGGDGPRRFFSSALWGTIVYPDESVQLPAPLSERILTHSPFSAPVASNADWRPRGARRHLVYTIGQVATAVASAGDARACAGVASDMLAAAVSLHNEVRPHVSLRDGTASYQAAWRAALNAVVANRGSDYEYLELLS